MPSRIVGCKITELCAAIPRQHIAVAQYASHLLTEKEVKRLTKSTGFNSLRITEHCTTTADLCEAAARKLQSLGDVDALIFVTQTPDYILPASVRGLQHKLNLPSSTYCFEINEGCSGYIHGMYLASILISSMQCKKVLLLCGDTISKLTSPQDRATFCIFGDAGSATIVEADDHNDSALFHFHLESWGEKDKTIIVNNSRHRNIEHAQNPSFLTLEGMDVMNFTLNEVPRHILTLLQSANKTTKDISLYACHQANKLILRSLSEKLKVAEGILPFVAGETGNTSSASIPLLLSQNYYQQTMKKYLNTVCCCGFGVGLSAASMVADFSNTLIHEVIEL